MLAKFHHYNICAIALTILLAPRISQAQIAAGGGVVFDMSTNGRQAEIDDVELQIKKKNDGTTVNHLFVKFKNGSRSIRLPSGSLSLIARYETSHHDDQLPISADNYLFGASPEGPFRSKGSSFSKAEDTAKQLLIEYAREMSIEEPFALALLQYDAYADAIICDDIDTSKLGNHPLARGKHPDRAIADIVRDPQQMEVFRSLFKSFSTPPICIGEILLSYEQADKEQAGNKQTGNATPQIKVRTRRWFMGFRWDQEMTVLDDRQGLIADLPYRQLGNDIEAHWDDYRNAFPALGELSSIAECLAVLRILRTQHPDQYRRIHNEIAHINESKWHAPEVSSSVQTRQLMTADDWHAHAIEQIGPFVENEVDAEAALALRMYKWQSPRTTDKATAEIEYPETWTSGFKHFAESGTPLLRAKIALVSALDAGPAESLPLFKVFFATVEQQTPNSLGLWLQSLRWLRVYCIGKDAYEVKDHQELLTQQRAEVLSVANTRMEQILAGKAGPAAATRFLEISFGTRLFDQAAVKWASRDDNNQLDSQDLVDLVKRMAKIHLLSIHESVTHKHDHLRLLAHHRYLGYLANKVPGAKLAIDDVRMSILASLTP